MIKIIIAIYLVVLFCVAGFGQKNKTEPQTVDGNKKSARQSAKKDGNVMLQSGVSLQGELQKTPDVKNASVGDEVVLRVTKSIKQNGEVVVPKGTRLIGKITEVQEKTKSNGMSKLGVVFEQIQGKSLNAPINASIVSITQAAANANLGDGAIDSGVSGSTSSSGSASGGKSGGGLLGGVESSVGGVVNTTTNTVGGVVNTAGQTLGGATNTLGSAVKGISLSQSADASAQGSTTLSAQGKNVRLEKGVVFGIRLNESVGYNKK